MKFKVFSIIIAVAFLTACQKSSIDGGNEQPELGSVSLQVSLPEFSKAGLSGESCVWEAGDSISVWDGSGVRVFRTANGGSSTAEFTGNAAAAEKYYVVYPAGNCYSYAAGKADVLIPERQEARPSSIAADALVCYGVAVGGKTALKAVGSVMQIEVQPGIKALTEIVIDAAEPVSGYLVITSEPEGVKPVFIGSSNTVTLVPQKGESFIRPGKYNVSITPAALQSGVDVTFNNAFYPKASKHVDDIAGKAKTGCAFTIGAFDPLENIVEEEPDDPSTDPQSAYGFDLASLNSQRHPRVLFNAEDFISLRKVVEDPSNAALPIVMLHKNVIDFANSMIRKHTDPIPEPTADVPKTEANTYAVQAINRMVSSAYAWIMTKDEKYLTKAREDLARICTFANWYPQSYLTAAELQFAASITYDWLYYDLTLAERTAAHNAIKTLGLGSCPSSHISQHNNWNQVCNACLLCSALAIYEKDKTVAAQHIDKVVEVNIPAVEEIYGTSGSFAEGYSYWGYGTGYQVVLDQALLSAFGNAAGLENQEGFCKTADYILYMSDNIAPFPYADGGRDAISEHLPQWWFAARQGRSELLFDELALLEKGKYVSSSRFLPLLPLYLIKYNAASIASAAKPSKDIWSGDGVAPMVLVRTGWTGGVEDAYLAMKGGKANQSHGHMDEGTFVFDWNGIRWVDEIVKTGGYAPYENALAAIGKDFWSYAQDSGRWDVFVMNNIAHPTLSFANNDGSVANKVHDTDHYADGRASLTATIDTDTEKGGTLDMTEVFKGQVASAKRTAVLKDGNAAVITDEITALAGQDAQLVWTAPTKVPFTVDDDCIEMVKGTKEMYLYVQSSDPEVKPVFSDLGNSRPVGRWGWVARDWDQVIEEHRIMCWTATIPAGRTVKFVTTISTFAPGQGQGGGENERPEM